MPTEVMTPTTVRVLYHNAMYWFRVEAGVCIIRAYYPHSTDVEHPATIPSEVACQAIRELYYQLREAH